MKPRFQLALYPLSGNRLWIVLTVTDFFQTIGGITMPVTLPTYTTLDAEETAAFWRL